MITYKLTSNPSVVIRQSDGMVIPGDTGNCDWQGYQAWLKAGNTPAAADQAPLSSHAQQLLAATDGTVTRITEAVALGHTTWTAADVVAWMNYRRTLRSIVTGGSGAPTSLPATPPYPAGT